MAWCDLCKRDDGFNAKPGEPIPDTCVPHVIFGNHFPIPYGHESEGWVELGIEPPPRCHDCRVKIGGLHHPGCDMERCPVCVATNGRGKHPEARRMGQRGRHVQAMLCEHCKVRRLLR